MSKHLAELIREIRRAMCDGRHDGIGNPVIDIDLYWMSALAACDEIERIKTALEDAMVTRHFCDQEYDPNSSPDQPDRPYVYDRKLLAWAEALGERVYSDWPNPGKKQVAKEAADRVN